MATWKDEVIADVKKQFPAIADDLLAVRGLPFSATPHILVVAPSYPSWLFKIDKRRVVKLGRSIQDFSNRRDNYWRACLALLDKINFYDTGSALISDIDASGNDVLIRPFTIYSAKEGPNAETIPRDKAGVTGSEDAAREAGAKGMPIYDDDGLPRNHDGKQVGPDGKPLASSGYGTGSDAIVNFSPDSLAQITGPGSQTDEALFHELVHALRMLRGVFTGYPVNQDYVDEEEYLAIVLGNVYCSEKRETVFRGAALPYFRAGKFHTVPLRRPEKFLDNVQGVDMTPLVLIERFRLNMPKLYCAFAKVPATSAAFNPIREFEERRIKAGKPKCTGGF